MKALKTVVGIVVLVMLVGAGVVLAQEDMMTYTVRLGGSDELGSFLVDADGLTLYRFANDEPAVTSCYDRCAENWPPLLVAEDQLPTLAEGVPGRLGVITRQDETRQVAYNGMPLYYFINDQAEGDATGQGANDVWFVVTPPDVGLGGSDELGTFLVGANGLTLYRFANDEMGESACYDRCAENWPPLLVNAEEDLTTLPGLVGQFGVTERTDGTFQVTYDEWPLYFFVNDEAPGDTAGQGANEVWFVVQPPTVSVGGSDELGTFLVGPDGMTLYRFTNDQLGESACYDRCAENWPPLLVAEGQVPTASEDVMGELGVTGRTDGTFQVTYDGMPLYYWVRDVVPGDATGQNVGEVWFVVEAGGGM